MARHRLSGQIVNNSDANIYRWFGYEVCCPQDVQRIIEDTPEGEDITLEINSGGGSVYAGFEMYSTLRACSNTVTAEVQSVAGSAMSVVIAACDSVLMSPVANIMIHRASIGYTSGNAEKMEQNAQMLNTIDESILNAYEAKTGEKCTRTKLRHMMENETFLTAQEAIDCGLADGMIETTSGESNPLDAVACIAPIAGILHACVTLPPVEDLKRNLKENYSFNSPNTDEQPTNNSKEGNDMEYNTKEDLISAFPELTAQLQEDARAAEQQRIAEIDAVAMPGFENIIDAAKADPTQTAGSVAMAIIAQQKQQGTQYMQDVHDDATNSGANSVPAAAALEGTENDPKAQVAQEAQEAVEMWKKRQKGEN